MRLYYNWRSICSSMVYLHVLEKQIDGCEFVHVNLEAAEQIEPWFITLNPKGQVPVLVDGERVVPDSLAISLFLEGEGARGRPLVWPAIADHCLPLLRALHTVEFFAISVGEYVSLSEDRKKMMAERTRQYMRDNPQLADRYATRLRAYEEEKLSALVDPEIRRDHWEKALDVLDRLERQAERAAGPWIFGGEFSVLDAHVTPFLARLWRLKRADLVDARPRLRGMWDAVQTRASFRTVFARPCGIHGDGCFCK